LALTARQAKGGKTYRAQTVHHPDVYDKACWDCQWKFKPKRDSWDEEVDVKITFFDLETTGLDPKVHEIIELAALEVDPETLEVTRSYAVKVKPERLHTAHPKALEVNGYTASGWTDAINRKEALQHVFPLLENTIPAGHNVNFDIGFFQAAYREANLPDPGFHKITLDTKTLAQQLREEGLYPKGRSLSLDAVCQHFGIYRPSPHRAYEDAFACIEFVKAAKKLRSESN
jgi:DNA polymerase-3 subunit alpha (Gram-positive type)